MNTIVWNKRYEIGVDFIDKEHKQLFSTINKLLVLSQEEGMVRQTRIASS